MRLLDRKKKRSLEYELLTAEEILRAQQRILLIVQMNNFASEINNLQGTGINENW